LAYVPGKGLFLADSEVNESPFNSTINMFLVQPNDGGPLTRLAPYNLTGFTIEPTGLAYAPSTDPNDPSKDLLYISDDDADGCIGSTTIRKSSWRFGPRSAARPTRRAWPRPIRRRRPLTTSPRHLAIREVNTAGTLVRTISLPSAITDPEALLWDDVHNVFFIGGKFSPNVWVLDGNGALLDTITLLADHRRPGGAKARVWFGLAPSSVPATIRVISASTSPTTVPTASTMAACSRSISALSSGRDARSSGAASTGSRATRCRVLSRAGCVKAGRSPAM
jgi:hypothetical protein